MGDKANKIHIGYIVDWLDNEYQKQIAEGIIEAVNENSIKITLFEGAAYIPKDHDAKKNYIFNLAKTSRIDGLIIQAVSLSHYFKTLTNLKDFCDSYSQPAVCIGLEIPGHPSIVPSHLQGFEDLLNHLIIDHGYKKFLLVTGPEDNNEVQMRIEMFKKVVEKHNLEINSSHIINGEFIHSRAYAAIKNFLKNNSFDFDAIVSFNDDMAFGIIQALKELSINVPDNVAISGFDNVSESAYFEPGLSTIDQNLKEQGRQAVLTLLKRINGQKVPEKIDIETKAVIRESCGCKNENIKDRSIQSTNNEYLRLKERNRLIDDFRTTNINIRLRGKKIWDLLVSKLSFLEVSMVIVVLFDKKSKSLPTEYSRIPFAYIDANINIDTTKIFLTEELIPQELQLNLYQSYIIEPISHEDKVFGYLVFNYKSDLLDIYRTLRNILSNIFFEGILFKRVKMQKDILIKQKKQLKENLDYMRSAMSAFIETLVKTVEIKDPYTAGHQRRVSDLARSIALELGLGEFEVEGIRMAGIIHDLGKIYVPTEILNKPGKLRDMEFRLIKTHPTVAYDILKSIHFPWPIADIVLQHHEHLDGTGYPNNLKKNDILLAARIIAVADVVEAMASHRPYRPSLGVDKALTEIFSKKDVFFDAEIVDICIRLFTQKDYNFSVK
ncbi:MAG: substrate-binding domain-containing protein [Spirochaetales bacterium]|nr:substrate-binding domain-containing protein [Spirochaetales bacterium]